jgi:hypothetical protein
MNLMRLKISNCCSKVGQKFRNKWFILAHLKKMSNMKISIWQSVTTSMLLRLVNQHE